MHYSNYRLAVLAMALPNVSTNVLFTSPMDLDKARIWYHNFKRWCKWHWKNKIIRKIKLLNTTIVLGALVLSKARFSQLRCWCQIGLTCIFQHIMRTKKNATLTGNCIFFHNPWVLAIPKSSCPQRCFFGAFYPLSSRTSKYVLCTCKMRILPVPKV